MSKISVSTMLLSHASKEAWDITKGSVGASYLMTCRPKSRKTSGVADPKNKITATWLRGPQTKIIEASEVLPRARTETQPKTNGAGTIGFKAWGEQKEESPGTGPKALPMMMGVPQNPRVNAGHHALMRTGSSSLLSQLFPGFLRTRPIPVIKSMAARFTERKEYN
jgi:hypothetical protein